MAVDDALLEAISSYVETYSGLDGPEAREGVRQFFAGETTFLPVALSPEGEAVRAGLMARLSPVAGVTGGASSARPEPAMTQETRAVLFRAMAGPRLLAFADALTATGTSIEEGKAAIAIAQANLPPERPAVPSVAERATGQVEFGGGAFDRVSPAEQAKAGWRQAFKSSGMKVDWAG